MNAVLVHPVDRSWLTRHRWLILRRVSQIGTLGLFLLGPLAGLWLIKGNLSSSLVLDLIPLTDPFVLSQTLFAGNLPEQTALLGAAIVTGFYMLVSGRVFCSWVCPVNLLTDLAAWLRLELGWRSKPDLPRSLRYWLLGSLLVVCAATGMAVWEWINPVSMFHRGLIFGVGLAWSVLLAVFLFDLLITQRGWCGHICPMGAFYSLLGFVGLIRVSAFRRQACNDCMDCFRVCPEPQVIQPALKGADLGLGPIIKSNNCTNCGRCIDVCDQDVFKFSTRFANKMEISP